MKRLDVIVFDMCRNVQTILDERFFLRDAFSQGFPSTQGAWRVVILPARMEALFKIEIYKHQRQHSR
jgi:hypothetical protein